MQQILLHGVGGLMLIAIRMTEQSGNEVRTLGSLRRILFGASDFRAFLCTLWWRRPFDCL